MSNVQRSFREFFGGKKTYHCEICILLFKKKRNKCLWSAQKIVSGCGFLEIVVNAFYAWLQ